ncbi:MAG: elongation factor 1-alpha C-terminal domain-related protein, partial [Phycisphaerales bacterium]
MPRRSSRWRTRTSRSDDGARSAPAHCEARAQPVHHGFACGATRDTSAQQLAANDIGRITVRTTAPIMHDPYHRSRTTGAFILVDESTNA